MSLEEWMNIFLNSFANSLKCFGETSEGISEVKVSPKRIIELTPDEIFEFLGIKKILEIFLEKLLIRLSLIPWFLLVFLIPARAFLVSVRSLFVLFFRQDNFKLDFGKCCYFICYIKNMFYWTRILHTYYILI